MDEALWVLGRATGVIGLALLTVSVVLGILTRSGRPAFGLSRFAVTPVHRNASLLGTAFILVHVVSLLFDSYAQLELVDFFVPFLAELDPLWLGLGTVSFDLLLAVAITGMLRNRIGQRAFRFVHWASYALWPISMAHALGSGSDAGSGWFLTFAGICTLVVVGAVVWRLTPRFVEFQARRAAEKAPLPATVSGGAR